MLITLNIFLKLSFPVSLIVRRPSLASFTIMAVPETTMDENYSLVFRQNNVRFSGKVFYIFSKSKTLAVQ